jgi:Alcohol dehydrogenase GroES-like domain/DDE domain
MTKISYKWYRFPPEIIQQAIWLYLRFTLSFRDVEDLLAERGIIVSYETVRRRPKPYTTWHLDEVYLKIDGRMAYLWRAVDVGAGVTAFRPGDRVLISCISSCGKCEHCRGGMYSHRTTGGWILGNEIDGTQAEYVRIPHPDTSLYPIPEEADEEALVMLSDIL